MSFFSDSGQSSTEASSSAIEENSGQPGIDSSEFPNSETALTETRKQSNVIRPTPQGNTYRNSRKEAKMRDLQKRRQMKGMQAEKQRQERQYYLSVILPQQQRASQQKFDNFTKMRQQIQTQEMINLQRESNYLQRNQNSLQGRQNNLLQQQILERQFDRYRARPWGSQRILTQLVYGRLFLIQWGRLTITDW